MQSNTITMPAMTPAMLARLLEILAPYRSEPITAPLLSLALQLAQKEVAA